MAVSSSSHELKLDDEVSLSIDNSTMAALEMQTAVSSQASSSSSNSASMTEVTGSSMMQERRESTSAKREEEQVVEPGDVLLLLLRLRCRLLGVQEGGGKFRGHTWQGGGEGEVLEVAFTTVLTEATATQNENEVSSSRPLIHCTV